MTSHAPVYVLIHPDGKAEWGSDLSVAEDAMGPHGVGKGKLGDGARLRIMMSDCALIMPETYALNLYATTALSRIAAINPNEAPETRGPVAVFGYDPYNNWDSTRPFTVHERDLITRALAEARCTVA